MHPRKWLSAFIVVMLALPAKLVLSQPATTTPVISTISFAPGSTLSTVNGQLVVGGCDLYYVQAKAGQAMLVLVDSESDITFQVYAPGTSIANADDGRPLIRGKTLPNAGADDNAKAWVAAISQSGNYLIAVGTGESGAVLSSYRLTVSLQ